MRYAYVLFQLQLNLFLTTNNKCFSLRVLKSFESNVIYDNMTMSSILYSLLNAFERIENFLKIH